VVRQQIGAVDRWLADADRDIDTLQREIDQAILDAQFDAQTRLLPCQVHQIDVLHARACLQMLQQPTRRGRL
jgi:hypothetical protein